MQQIFNRYFWAAYCISTEYLHFMFIAICSDSHDNLINVKKFLTFCEENNVEAIIHCGDWCAPSMLKFFRKHFDSKIYGVFGNVHADEETILKFAKNYDIKIQEDELNLEIDDIKIVLTHFPDKAKKLAELNKYDIIFYGHTHKPWQEKINNTYLINPGTLAGMFYKATFAVYDTLTKKLTLKILERLVV